MAASDSCFAIRRVQLHSQTPASTQSNNFALKYCSLYHWNSLGISAYKLWQWIIYFIDHWKTKSSNFQLEPLPAIPLIASSRHAMGGISNAVVLFDMSSVNYVLHHCILVIKLCDISQSLCYFNWNLWPVFVINIVV